MTEKRKRVNAKQSVCEDDEDICKELDMLKNIMESRFRDCNMSEAEKAEQMVKDEFMVMAGVESDVM